MKYARADAGLRKGYRPEEAVRVDLRACLYCILCMANGRWTARNGCPTDGLWHSNAIEEKRGS
jgi:formate hydrogenlyase subunit 6/NADH:ubiquinone oxidoreductase subunit I